MGLFNSNRGHLGLDYDCDEIVANENYTHEFGIGQMLVDAAKNDMAIFEALIADDFKEVMAVQEGVEYVNEASFGAFIDKIKTFLKNAWEKIKGIIKSFLTKFVAMFIRDNAELVKKYEKEVRSKTKLSKMKYKWSECKVSEADKIVSNLSNAKKYLDASEEEVENDYIDKVLSGILGKDTTEADFAADFWETIYEDVDTVEGLDNARLTYIIDTLKTAKATQKAMKDAQTKADKYFKEALKDVDALDKDLKKDGNASKDDMAVVNTMYKAVNITQKGVNMTISNIIKSQKFEVAQARRVFVQAAAFNEKAVKEDAILFEAIGECAEEFDILD